MKWTPNLKALYDKTLYLSVFAIPISPFVSVRLLMITAFLSFFVHRNFRQLFDKSWDLMLFMLILVIGLVYSDDVMFGLRIIETSFSLILIPVIFAAVNRMSKERLALIFDAFSAGVIVASAICVAAAIVRFSETGSAGLFTNDFTSVIQSHPTYLAYYIILSIIWGLYVIYHDPERRSPWLISVVTMFLFMMLVLTGGRTAFASFLLVSSFFLLKYIVENKPLTRNLGFAVVCAMIVLLFVVHIPFWKDVNLPKGDYWERGVLWKSAIQATRDPVFGVGTGDYRKELNDFYNRNGLTAFAAESYNAHNQFIQSYFSNGVIGLVALLIALSRPIAVSVSNQNTLGILVMFPFIIYGVTEVFLGRYQGVVFFALFHQLVMYASEFGVKPITLQKQSL